MTLSPSIDSIAECVTIISDALPAHDPASRTALAQLVALVMQDRTAIEVLSRRVAQLERTRLMVVRSANGD